MKLKKLAAATMLALAAPMTFGGVLFDPDGVGPLPAMDLGALDWFVTSGVAVGGNAAISNFSTGSGPTTFDILTHARLTATSDQQGNPNTPAGLNTTYEITMVARFQERVTSVSGTTATFATTGTGPTFLEIFYGVPRDSIDVSGSGFNNGDVILRGTTVPAGITGSFTVTNSTPVRLDQFNTDDYPGQLTVTGRGDNEALPVGGITTDPAFFRTPLATMGITFNNISQALPFNTVNPSDCFTQNASGVPVVGPAMAVSPPQPCAPIHILGPYSANTPDAFGGLVPVTGPVNGLFGGGGPDFVFQTDYNAAVSPAQLPEPGSLALFGMGLLGLSLGAFRRRRAKQA